MTETNDKKPDEMEQFLKRGIQVKPKSPPLEIKEEEEDNNCTDNGS